MLYRASSPRHDYDTAFDIKTDCSPRSEASLILLGSTEHICVLGSEVWSRCQARFGQYQGSIAKPSIMQCGTTSNRSRSTARSARRIRTFAWQRWGHPTTMAIQQRPGPGSFGDRTTHHPTCIQVSRNTPVPRSSNITKSDSSLSARLLIRLRRL